jgi:hypothetical protein
MSPGTLAGRAAGVAVAGIAAAVAASALLDALKAMRGAHPQPFDFAGHLVRLLSPSTPAAWLALAEPVILGVFVGLAAAGLLAARHGIRR